MRSPIIFLNVILGALILGSIPLEWHLADKSSMGRKRTDAELIGKKVEDILYNVPILPDQVRLESWADDGIALGYCREIILGLEYPARILYLKNGNVVRAITDREVAIGHD